MAKPSAWPIGTVHFFIQWVVLCFTALVDTWQNQFRQLSHFYALLFGFLLLQCIVLLSTFSLNVLNYWGSHLSWTGIDSDILFKDIGLNLSFGILMGVIFLRYLYMREQWFRQQSSGLNARIQAMQARIHPHFLFNSINSVVSLISTDPDRAETMLISLSKLFVPACKTSSWSAYSRKLTCAGITFQLSRCGWVNGSR